MRHWLHESIIENPFTSYNVDENTYKKCVLFSAQFQGNSHSLTPPSPPPTTIQIFRWISETLLSQIQVKKVATFTDVNGSAVEAPNAM